MIQSPEEDTRAKQKEGVCHFLSNFHETEINATIQSKSVNIIFLEREIYPPCRKATKTDNCLSRVPFGDSGKDGSIHKLIIVQETLEFFSSRI